MISPYLSLNCSTYLSDLENYQMNEKLHVLPIPKSATIQILLAFVQYLSRVNSLKSIFELTILKNITWFLHSYGVLLMERAQLKLY